MAADKRGKYVANHGAVGRGVTGEPLQRIDSSEPNVELDMAELIDRSGEPLGDLSLLCNLELLVAVGKLLAAVGHLPVGEVGTYQEDHAAKPL